MKFVSWRYDMRLNERVHQGARALGTRKATIAGAGPAAVQPIESLQPGCRQALKFARQRDLAPRKPLMSSGLELRDTNRGSERQDGAAVSTVAFVRCDSRERPAHGECSSAGRQVEMIRTAQREALEAAASITHKRKVEFFDGQDCCARLLTRAMSYATDDILALMLGDTTTKQHGWE